MTDISRTQIAEAIQRWIRDLEGYPGWREWNEKKLEHTLFFDDITLSHAEKHEREFNFSEEVEKQRLVIVRYIELNLMIDSLKECEYYFRRYPFRDLPVTRSSHITNICEMYFSRCYQFQQRLKKHFKAVEDMVPAHAKDRVKKFAADFINDFNKEFKEELKARNRVHHHKHFSEIGIDRIALREIFLQTTKNTIQQKYQLQEYRKEAKFWVQQVQASSEKMDAYMERIAEFTLECCEFLLDAEKSTKTSD